MSLNPCPGGNNPERQVPRHSDSPQLNLVFPSITDTNRKNASNYFDGFVQYVFQCKLGVADPICADYISALLARFLRTENFYRIRTLQGIQITDIGGMLREIDCRLSEGKAIASAHLGDHLMFCQALFPDALNQKYRGREDTVDLKIGVIVSKAYSVAAKIYEGCQNDKAAIYHWLSENTELCVYGIGEVVSEFRVENN